MWFILEIFNRKRKGGRYIDVYVFLELGISNGWME